MTRSLFPRACLLVALTLPLTVIPSGGAPTVTQVHAAAPQAAASVPRSAQVTETLSSSSVMFIENVGQFNEDARFQVLGAMGASMWLADDAIWVTLVEPAPEELERPQMHGLSEMRAEYQSRRGVKLKLSFAGANPSPRVVPCDPLGTRVSYFIGNDPADWHRDVPVWGGVRYENLYAGMDLVLTATEGHWSWRFEMDRVGVDLRAVRLRVEGADNLAFEGNYLRLTTLLGDIALPLLTVEGATPRIEPAISVVDKVHQVSTPFASISPLAVNATQTSISSLLYSTYLGGRSSERGYDIALDDAGNVYITGQTSSTDFPTTPGAYDRFYSGGSLDVFVSKLSADGSTLLYSTYLGGNGDDVGTGITVDSTGSVYIAGLTFSTDFPTTPGVLDTTLSGGRDAFAAKLSAAGDDLVYSTYLGGDSWDYGFCIAIDDTGNAYVGGFTHGSFPITSGAAQMTFGGSGDGFATKLSPDASTLQYSTYLGGYSWEGIEGIAVDNAGNAYLASHTHSTDFPTTPDAWDRICDNCQTNISTDGAVAKLNADGSEFVYSTLIGGADASGTEAFTDIAIDSAGNAYLIGQTSSTDFPTTANALQPLFGGGESDAVVAKLNADGSDLLHSTYLGGSGADSGYGIALDGDGNVYVTGYTASTDFATVDPLQAANAGGYDAFVAKANEDGSALLYSTYLGGTGDENCQNPPGGDAGIALDSTGNIHFTGFTGSTDFPTTTNAYDVSFNGGTYDAFVTSLDLVPIREERMFLPLILRQ